MCLLNNIIQVSEQSQPAEETTESSEWNVVGPLNSTSLPPKISDFCGTFPILKIEILDPSTTLPEESGKKTCNM